MTPNKKDNSVHCNTQFAATILSGRTFIFVFKNHTPITSIATKITIAIKIWIRSVVENTSFNLFASSFPIS